MIKDKKVIVVLPAYNAAATLEATYLEIPLELVDEVVMVDDGSHDATVAEARRLGIRHILCHAQNLGYGGNQKTCYRKALALGGDIIIMLHPDYQYTPKLIPAMAHLIAAGVYPVVLGSRILGRGALAGGMPLYKYICNRGLTFIQNIFLGQKLSEYHTGFRAYSREVLQSIAFEQGSNDFIFDNQILAQIIYAGYEIAEITCPTHYSAQSSSINFRRSLVYGLGVLATSLTYRLQCWGLVNLALFRPSSPELGKL
jgi:glycosyltransferase involved in cell wall biosynthesis